jgi:hypothetical protein
MPRAIRKPSNCLHKAAGQTRVRIDGKDVYLGEHGSPASRNRFEQLVGDWLNRQSVDPFSVTIDELCLMFLDWADGYYRRADGFSTGARGEHPRCPAVRRQGERIGPGAGLRSQEPEEGPRRGRV